MSAANRRSTIFLVKGRLDRGRWVGVWNSKTFHGIKNARK
jgi:hypothetical protein